MKALILAGGVGTRLRPITHTSAKQLVPVANKPILFYGLEAIAEVGITEVGMIVGDTASEVQEAIGDGSNFGLKVTYIPQEAPLGLAHCVLVARDFLGDEPFVMYLGDNLLLQGISEFVERFESNHSQSQEEKAAAQLLLARVPDPERFGVAVLDDHGRVTHLVEKPKDPPSNLGLVGVYIFDANVHEAVRAISPSARGELEITDAIQWLIDHGHRVDSDIVDDYWKFIDTGELGALLSGNRLVLGNLNTRIDGTVDKGSQLEGRVVVEGGAQITRSRLEGPVLIGADAVIEDSHIGPYTSIGAECRVINSKIEHSILLQRATVTDVPHIEESLIGKEAEVSCSGREPSATRLMIGDHSKVDVV